jgi:hypothetical protein
MLVKEAVFFCRHQSRQGDKNGLMINTISSFSAHQNGQFYAVVMTPYVCQNFR